MIEDVIRPGSARKKATRKNSFSIMLGTLLHHKRLAAAISLFVIIIAVTGFLAWQHFAQPGNLNNVTTIERLIGRHYILPTGEQPTLATVTDKSKLQTAFLRKADNGDKILIYEKAAVAIIYRPSVDRIVAVGPVEVQPLKTNQ